MSDSAAIPNSGDAATPNSGDAAIPNSGDTAEFFSPSAASAASATSAASAAAATDVDEEVCRLRKQAELLSNELNDSTAQIAVRDATIADISADRDAIARQNKELESKLLSLKEVVNRLEEETNAASASAEEARSELQRSKAELEEASRRRTSDDAAYAAAKADAERKLLEGEGKIRELEALLSEERKKVDRATAEAAVAEIKALEKEKNSNLGIQKGGCTLASPWAAASASAAAVVTVGAVYLHLSRRR